jgi:hypothetical protein
MILFLRIMIPALLKDKKSKSAEKCIKSAGQ